MAFGTTFWGLMILADARGLRVEFTPFDEEASRRGRPLRGHDRPRAGVRGPTAAAGRGHLHFTGGSGRHGPGPVHPTRKRMHRDALIACYQELRDYVGWTEGDAELVASIGLRLE